MKKADVKRWPMVIWLTGFSGAGKTTLARKLTERLAAEGVVCESLDGDVVRAIFPQTGFTREEREAHIRRVGYLASRLEHAGACVVAAFISPYRESRAAVRAMCRHFIEVHVSTSLAVCEARDAKGLYRRARAGEVPNFTGISDPYEAPENPDIHIDTDGVSVEVAADILYQTVKKKAAVWSENSQ